MNGIIFSCLFVLVASTSALDLDAAPTQAMADCICGFLSGDIMAAQDNIIATVEIDPNSATTACVENDPVYKAKMDGFMNVKSLCANGADFTTIVQTAKTLSTVDDFNKISADCGNLDWHGYMDALGQCMGATW